MMPPAAQAVMMLIHLLRVLQCSVLLVRDTYVFNLDVKTKSISADQQMHLVLKQVRSPCGSSRCHI